MNEIVGYRIGTSMSLSSRPCAYVGGRERRYAGVTFLVASIFFHFPQFTPFIHAISYLTYVHIYARSPHARLL